MLLSRSNYDAATAFVARADVSAVAQKLLNASVKLYGVVGQDVFTGSATILGTGNDVVYKDGVWEPEGTQFTVLMTCKHVLYVACNGGMVPTSGGETVWKEGYIDTFKNNIKIRYSSLGRDNSFNTSVDNASSAKIDHIVPIFEKNIGALDKMIAIPEDKSSDRKPFMLVNLDGKTKQDGTVSGAGSDGISPTEPSAAWAYDVMLLLSKDANLYALANAPQACGYQDGTEKEKFEEIFGWDHDDYKANCSVKFLNTAKFTLCQVGFGQVTDMQNEKDAKPIGEKSYKLPTTASPGQSGCLQYKIGIPTNMGEAEFVFSDFGVAPSQFVLKEAHALVLNCASGDNSTFKGDSGGGIFAVERPRTAPQGAALTSAYLVGVTTGSGVATAPDKAADVRDYANNVSTSLGVFYDHLFDLKYQNV